MKDLYVVIVGGQVCEETHSEDEALMCAQNHVEQYITDFLDHDLPLKIKKEVIKRMDIYVAKVSDANLVELPYQQWADEYYEEMKEYERHERDREYNEFLKLYEKYKDRLPND